MICEFVKTACDKECAVFKIIMSITPCAEPVDGDTTGSVALSTLPTPNAQVQCESWHQSTKVCQVCAIVSVLGRAPLLSAKNIKELEDSQPRRALNSPWASYLLAMQGKVAGQTTNDGPCLTNVLPGSWNSRDWIFMASWLLFFCRHLFPRMFRINYISPF